MRNINEVLKLIAEKQLINSFKIVRYLYIKEFVTGFNESSVFYRFM